MTAELRDSLAHALALLDRATPWPWKATHPLHRVGGIPGVKSETHKVDVAAFQYQADSDAAVAAVNFLRTHSAEIAGALRDAGTVIRVGNYGAAFDPPGSRRAFTYQHQPGNVDASRLGRAADEASKANAGDSIDRGLALLKALQEIGFGVYQIIDSAMQQGGGGGEA